MLKLPGLSIFFGLPNQFAMQLVNNQKEVTEPIHTLSSYADESNLPSNHMIFF